MKKKIKDLPLSQRPQEKLLQQGSSALMNEELVAILLGTGNRKENAIALAQTLIKKVPFSQFDKNKLLSQKIPGVGKTKLSRILAALELGERLSGRQSFDTMSIHTVQDILLQVQEIVSKKQEHLVVLYLNARNQVVKKEIVAIGKVNVLQTDMREIFSPALTSPCVCIIVVHNHPSGDPSPSDADILFTQRLHEAGKLLGIVLTDHVIVSKSSYFSFAKGE